VHGYIRSLKSLTLHSENQGALMLIAHYAHYVLYGSSEPTHYTE